MNNELSDGQKLERAGWLQGKLISKANGMNILAEGAQFVDFELDSILDKDVVFIVASQSCNIANYSVNTIQLSVGYYVEKSNAMRLHGRNPRLLDTELLRVVDDGIENLIININIQEFIFVQKSKLLEVEFEDDLNFNLQNLNSYINWLSAHYNRPALPSRFNDLLKKKEKVQRKKAKILSKSILGLYVQITPFSEIPVLSDEKYSVNLLAVISQSSDSNDIEIQATVKEFADIMVDAGMNVKAVALTEDKVSIAMISKFKRFYFDDLSYSDVNAPLPPEVTLGL